jgi:phosphatidylglycerol lysyltransferase
MWLTLALRWVRVHGRRFYNFDGLDAFKSKFDPEEWEPIFAITDSVDFPPRALYAIAGAFSGGNPFLLIVKAVLRAARIEIARASHGLSVRSKPVIRQLERRRS